MSYLRRVFDDLDLLEKWRRDAMSPEERAAYDRAQRREAARDGVLLAGAVAVSLSVTVLPWVVGAYVMTGWVWARVSR